jgi:hypothetical protein
MDRLQKALARLCDLSVEKASSPWTRPWPESLPADVWCMTPELVSLYATETFEQLSLTQQKRLSFFEAVNFFSLNIHGERQLMQGLSQRLYDDSLGYAARYLHHFIDEENKHMFYFARFCRTYANKIYPERKFALSSEAEASVELFVFFAQVLLFEELVDLYNQRMAGDERLHPLVREINANHHADETRHLAFGRLLLAELLVQNLRDWSPETLAAVRQRLHAFLQMTWREYYNPSVYADAGIPDAYALLGPTWGGAAAKRHREELTHKATRFLAEQGIFEARPS